MQNLSQEQDVKGTNQDITDVARALGVIAARMLRHQGTQLFGVTCYSMECRDMVLRILGVFDELPSGSDPQNLTWFSDDLRRLLEQLESGGGAESRFHAYAFIQRGVIKNFIDRYGSANPTY
ncbi:hypothetical protein [Vreelandella olivaria]|uniref:hypothetical protein n=1 Tax=Vreelandella olivaria TaxID=390919 RepID=UPI00201F3929|nr:hypothetical protein [Halomonas olivaria]